MQIGLCCAWKPPFRQADCRNALNWRDLCAGVDSADISFHLHGFSAVLYRPAIRGGIAPQWSDVLRAIRVQTRAYLPSDLRWGEYIEEHPVGDSAPIPQRHPARISQICQMAGRPHYLTDAAALADGWAQGFKTQEYRNFYLLAERGTVWARSVSGVNQNARCPLPKMGVHFLSFAKSRLRGRILTIAAARNAIGQRRATGVFYRLSDYRRWVEMARAEIDRHHEGVRPWRWINLYNDTSNEDVDLIDLED